MPLIESAPVATRWATYAVATLMTICAEMELRHWLLRYFEESERLRK